MLKVVEEFEKSTTNVQNNYLSNISEKEKYEILTINILEEESDRINALNEIKDSIYSDLEDLNQNFHSLCENSKTIKEIIVIKISHEILKSGEFDVIKSFNNDIISRVKAISSHWIYLIQDYFASNSLFNKLFEMNFSLMHRIKKIIGSYESYTKYSTDHQEIIAEIYKLFSNSIKFLQITIKLTSDEFEDFESDEKNFNLMDMIKTQEFKDTQFIGEESSKLKKGTTLKIQEYSGINDALNLLTNDLVEILNVLLKYDDPKNFLFFIERSNEKSLFDLKLRLAFIKKSTRKYHQKKLNIQVEEADDEYEEDDDYFDGKYIGRISFILDLNIDRDKVWSMTIKEIERVHPSVFALAVFSISFNGETGSDMGGLTREWLHLISKEIFNPDYGNDEYNEGLFQLSSNKSAVQPNQFSYIVPNHLKHFYIIGKFIGKAILCNFEFKINFVKSFLKLLASKIHLNKENPIYISDLEDVDPETYRGLKLTLDNYLEDEIYLFEYDQNFFGKILLKELIPGGADIWVTDSTKKEYIKKYCASKMGADFQKQTDAMLSGIKEIIPDKYFSLLNFKDLSYILVGESKVDIDDLENTCIAETYNDETINLKTWLFEILREFDEKTKFSFIFYTTGSYKVPIGGFANFPLIIYFIGGTEHLPCAHTCANQLDLPIYPSKEVLREKLLIAIYEGVGGFFII